MSVRSARQWQTGPYPSPARERHGWRTRPDPLARCSRAMAPLLAVDEKRVLEARTILGELDRRHQRSVFSRPVTHATAPDREWRALHGPAKEVYFPQAHPPRASAPTPSRCKRSSNPNGRSYRR